MSVEGEAISSEIQFRMWITMIAAATLAMSFTVGYYIGQRHFHDGLNSGSPGVQSVMGVRGQAD